jgi:hypothetical protein
VTERWKRRPSGSTWGDWGEDDELGRVNLLTPEKVLQGVREVEAGISFCLSMPLDYPGGTALNQRRHPPVLAPTEDMEGNPDVFYNVHQSRMEKWGHPKYVDVWNDDVVTLSLQYSTQWDSFAHAGAEFDADGDGIEEPVYYNGYRAGLDLVGPKPDAAGDGGRHVCFAHHLGLEHMAFHGVQGRGVLVDVAHHLGHDWRAVDRKTLGAGRRQLCGRRPGRQGPRREPPFAAADPPPVSLQARCAARRAVVLARALGVASRARSEPVPAHGAPAAAAGRGGLAGDADRDGVKAS